LSSGSGCSADDAKPPWQADAGCATRTDNDVAAVADPSTGLAVCDTYDQDGWLEVGGTSASSPIIALHRGAGYDGPTGWGTPDGTAAFSGGVTLAATRPR
jgi:hypothetical protein